MSSFYEVYDQNPVSSLMLVHCYPWVKNNTALIGDAAHAIVPFYGQGLNCGFEDCRILNDLLNEYNDEWSKVFIEFQKVRKPDADAIAQLALNNFREMSEHVADNQFLLRKKIEARLHQLFPNKWVPLYSMVTFQDSMRYTEAWKIGAAQKSIMDDVMAMPDIDSKWETLDMENIISKLNT